MPERRQAQSSPDDDRTLCKLALKHGMLTEEQVRAALSLQARERRRGRQVDLEKVLETKGWISARQIEVLRRARDLLMLRGQERPFARDVVDRGWATREQLDDVLREQTRLFKQTHQFIRLEALLRDRGLLRDGAEDASGAVREIEGGDTNSDEALREPVAEQSHECAASREQSSAHGSAPGQGTVLEESADRLGKVIHREDAFSLIVSDDGMQAYLRLKAGAPRDLTVERLMALMESKGIVYGIVDERLLRRGLKHPSEKCVVFKVAEGAPPRLGRDAEIRFFLTPDGGLPAEGATQVAVSLKDRGTIPQVKQGDLLAEKTPAIPGVSGMDIFGSSRLVPDVQNESLLCGSGVSMSQDGLRATAKVDGRAVFSAYGKLTVLEEHTVPGDVSFETGNIDFNGIVFVHGVVQDGFRVRCGSLVCNEIGRAQVDAAGDVTVFGGVLGAEVRCQGDLTCVHIHASKVEALGDVQADKGIVDSKVKTSGRCVVKSGTVAASLVYAKQGIDAAQIGHERSRPCTLAIGFDPLMEKELDRIRETVAVKEAEAVQLRAPIEEMRAQLLSAEQRTGEIAQLQDLTLRERRTTIGMLEDARRLQDKSLLPDLEEALAELDATAKQRERELEESLDMQDQLKAMIRAQAEKVRGIEREVASLKEEMAVITSWGQKVPASVAIRVRGQIFAGTSIRGVCAMATLKDTLSRVSIREATVDAASGETAMRVSRLR